MKKDIIYIHIYIKVHVFITRKINRWYEAVVRGCILLISHCSTLFLCFLCRSAALWLLHISQQELIWLQQQPENVTPRITPLVSVTSQALMELYVPRPVSLLWSRGSTRLLSTTQLLSDTSTLLSSTCSLITGLPLMTLSIKKQNIKSRECQRHLLNSY